MSALYLGVDPGASGAAVAIDESGKWQRIVLPHWNYKLMHPLSIEQLRTLARENIVRVAIEEPISHFRDVRVVKSMMSVAMSAGTWAGTLAAVGITDIRWVQPRSWQVMLGRVPKGETKRAACSFAGRVFGASFVQAIEAYGNGVADAGCIALWAYQQEARSRLVGAAEKGERK